MAPSIPIDIPAILKEVADIEGAVNTPISVSLYIDSTALGEVAAFVRTAFSSEGANVRVSVQYVDGSPVIADPTNDMAVIVAGFGDWIGREAARLRAAGVPVMVVSATPDLTDEMAQAFGNAIPAGDLISPKASSGSGLGRVVFESVLEVAGLKVPSVPTPESVDGVFSFDAVAKEALAMRMGQWVVAACADKKLAFALAFGFVRRPLASDLVRANSIQNAGIGAVVFIPGADMPLMTLNQARMLLQIAAAYGKPMSIERAKELAFVVGGAFACRSAARQIAGLVPGLGWAAKAGIAYAGTEAMGHAAIEYFEAGGDAAGLAGIMSKTIEFASQIARGR
ncbi:MAG: hypothetical protein IKV48_01320 [Eggerthellaceae bacterium]|nr:hypothetical protein [Eggerthellaceae bacterium]